LIYPDEITYSVETLWDHGTGGEVKLNGHTINFDTPAQFGGKGNAPCADQLFLASLSGCILDTFVNFMNRLGVETDDVKVKVSADVKLKSKIGYRINQINILFTVASEASYLEKNRKCAELAVEYCHLTKSIEPAIPLNVDIRIVEKNQTY
jgi:uncharacterized OsmC-like protein